MWISFSLKSGNLVSLELVEKNIIYNFADFYKDLGQRFSALIRSFLAT